MLRGYPRPFRFYRLLMPHPQRGERLLARCFTGGMQLMRTRVLLLRRRDGHRVTLLHMREEAR